MAKSIFVNAWQFSLTAKDGCPWDQIAKYGKFVKDGEEVEFSDLTLSQMLTDFSSRKNDLSADFDHQALMTAENGQPAPAVCFYDSMVLVREGKQLGFATHKEGITAPDVTNWSDGLYARRSEMTDLGKKLIGSYKWISPAFTTDGADEQGNPTGYQLLNVAWTNIPFLDGMEPLSFHRLGAKALKKLGAKFMSEDMKKSLGLAEDASDEACMAALTARLKKYDDDAAEMKKKMDDMESEYKAKLSKFDDADGDGDDDDKKKMDDAEMDDAESMDDGDADADAMKKMKKSLGLTSKAKMSKVFAAFEAKFVPMSELATLQKQLEVIKNEREEEKKVSKASAVETFVANAIKLGRYPSDKADKLKKLADKDMEVAQDALFDEGSFHALKRMTSGGRPLALSESLPALDLNAQDPNKLPEIDADGSKEAAKISAERKISFADALLVAIKEKPHLFQRRIKF